MLTRNQQAEAVARVEHFVKMGNDVFDTFMDMPFVKFEKRGQCGGTACFSTMELNFNAGLMQDNWDEYMNQVIPHEVAHLLKGHMYGDSGKGRLSAHGYYWKRVMRGLGVEPDRTHNMDTSKVAMPKKKFIYTCEGCGQEFPLSSVRHNRLARGTHNYQHCRGNKLVLKKALGKMTTRKAMDHTMPGFMQKAAMEAKKKPAKKAATKKVIKEPKSGTIGSHALKVYRAMLKGNSESTRQDIIQAISHSMQVTMKRAASLYQGAKRTSENV